MTNLNERRKYFKQFLPQLEYSNSDIKGLGNTCPSCGYPTLDERSSWEICAFCFWEDDGQDDHDADVVLGGPNGDYSLTEYREKWENAYSDIMQSDSATAEDFKRIDTLIELQSESNIPEILELVNKLISWFNRKRGIIS